jgi:hypothetical protein
VQRYDPEHAPNPEQWLALDEQERFALVEAHHRRARIKLPNLKIHAVFHAIVENQIAEGMESVVRAMTRLRTQGLSRHDAVHAVASVVAAHMHDLVQNKGDAATSNSIYGAAVERLTAKSWRGE